MSDWTKIANTPDYQRDRYVAIYKRTERGHGLYWTFRAATPVRERKQRNALVGGLPTPGELKRAEEHRGPKATR